MHQEEVTVHNRFNLYFYILPLGGKIEFDIWT